MTKETIITPETPFKLSITTLVSVAVSLLIAGVMWGAVEMKLKNGEETDSRLEKRADQNADNIMRLMKTLERIDERTIEIQKRIDRLEPRKYGDSNLRPTMTPIPQATADRG